MINNNRTVLEVFEGIIRLFLGLGIYTYKGWPTKKLTEFAIDITQKLLPISQFCQNYFVDQLFIYLCWKWHLIPSYVIDTVMSLVDATFNMFAKGCEMINNRSLNETKFIVIINLCQCRTVVPELLCVYGSRFNRLWWFQDGAPAHRLRLVKERLRELFGSRIVALNHDIEWPPISPCLTPSNYFYGDI